MLRCGKRYTKHKSFDLAMIVDDNQLSKKKVNLYEPIWIHARMIRSRASVINKIDRDRVSGYVSAPKYRNSELTQSLTPLPRKYRRRALHLPAPRRILTKPCNSNLCNRENGPISGRA